jgi:hypothetical protein
MERNEIENRSVSVLFASVLMIAFMAHSHIRILMDSFKNYMKSFLVKISIEIFHRS